MSKNNALIPADHIEHSILILRGQRVMLDSDLARMYGVSAKRLNESVKRNTLRFPKDFMFQLTDEEFGNLRSQIATSSFGGRRYLPYAFTEYGVVMLSSVLKSERAIAVNIEIMRTFGKYRGMLATNKDLAKKIDDLEKEYDERFGVIFQALKKLMAEPEKPKKQPIGFRTK